MSVSPSAYYKWKSGNPSQRIQENKHIASLIEKIHMNSPDKGYRRIHDDLERFHNVHSNDKRILRICRSLGIQSTVKFHPAGCTRHAKTPQHYAENILNRDFHAEKPNEKWLTDVTEFKYYEGPRVKKVYLSAILDLYDRRIVSFVIRDTNDISLCSTLL